MALSAGFSEETLFFLRCLVLLVMLSVLLYVPQEKMSLQCLAAKGRVLMVLVEDSAH